LAFFYPFLPGPPPPGGVWGWLIFPADESAG
jgi:hypothetical protein